MRILSVLVLFPVLAHAQFVWPKPEYNRHDPSVYGEDPYIVKYRKRFFSVFRGDFATFEKAYAEIEEEVRKNPNDPRALVWRGNGKTVRAGLLKFRKREKEALTLLADSRKDMDRAVAMRPDDPNIFMMRAATLYIQGQYWKKEELPRSVWATLASDCRRFLRVIGPKRIPKLSIHVRGEAYGELGIALKNLGDTAGARRAFETLLRTDPGTAYAERAAKEIAALPKA